MPTPFRLLLLTFVINVSFITYSMENKTATQELPDLPVDIWDQIFWWVNKDIETHEYRDDKDQAANKFNAIKNLIPLTRVNKKFNHASTIKIKQYLKQVSHLLAKYGGHESVLHDTIPSREFWNDTLIPLCCKLGADINTAKYTNSETYLTTAIKKNDDYTVEKILKWGADPMYPNDYGEMPIDIAYDKKFIEIAKKLKEYGGDPHHLYGFIGQNDFYSNGSYDRDFGCALLAKKIKEKKEAAMQKVPTTISNKALDEKSPKSPLFTAPRIIPIVTFIVGGVVGSIGHWIYSEWEEERKEKERELRKRYLNIPEESHA